MPSVLKREVHRLSPRQNCRQLRILGAGESLPQEKVPDGFSKTKQSGLSQVHTNNSIHAEQAVLTCVGKKIQQQLKWKKP